MQFFVLKVFEASIFSQLVLVIDGFYPHLVFFLTLANFLIIILLYPSIFVRIIVQFIHNAAADSSRAVSLSLGYWDPPVKTSPLIIHSIVIAAVSTPVISSSGYFIKYLLSSVSNFHSVIAIFFGVLFCCLIHRQPGISQVSLIIIFGRASELLSYQPKMLLNNFFLFSPFHLTIF